MIRKYAFTLSETLITLAIIGIVAAMTTPALINKFKERVTVTKLKKFYSVLSQSYLYAVQEYGEVSTWGITGRDEGSTDEEVDSYTAENAVFIRDRLFENAKVLKKCNNSKKMSECGMPERIYYIDGSSSDKAMTQTASLRLADGGAVLVMACDEGDERGSGALSEVYALIYIDINGAKEPNTHSKDYFTFYLTNQNIIPEGTQDETRYVFEEDCSSIGRGCTAWVIFNDNMDYLKCSDLDWNGKHKCS